MTDGVKVTGAELHNGRLGDVSNRPPAHEYELKGNKRSRSSSLDISQSVISFLFGLINASVYNLKLECVKRAENGLQA